MNDRQRNRIAMFKTVTKYMTGNSTVWSAIPATQKAHDDLGAAIAQIGSSVQKQETPTTGMTEDKAESRDALEAQIIRVAAPIAAYAALTDNNDLAALVDVTPSGLDTISEQRLDDTAERVHEAGTDHLDALADYGVTVAELDELRACIDDFEEWRDNPAAKMAGKAGETATLGDKIRAASGILNDRMDKLMVIHKIGHPEFYQGYQSARVIIDRRGPDEDDDQVPAP